MITPPPPALVPSADTLHCQLCSGSAESSRAELPYGAARMGALCEEAWHGIRVDACMADLVEL